MIMYDYGDENAMKSGQTAFYILFVKKIVVRIFITATS